MGFAMDLFGRTPYCSPLISLYFARYSLIERLTIFSSTLLKNRENRKCATISGNLYCYAVLKFSSEKKSFDLLVILKGFFLIVVFDFILHNLYLKIAFNEEKGIFHLEKHISWNLRLHLNVRLNKLPLKKTSWNPSRKIWTPGIICIY